MGLIEDFNKLHISIKSMLLSIVSTIPIFFISIYAFAHHLIDKIPNRENFFFDFNFYYLVALCFLLSISWIISNIALSFLTSFYITNILKEDELDIEYPFIVLFLYSVVYS